MIGNIMSAQSKKDLFTCEECGESFTRRYQLRLHKHKHSKRKNCEEVGIFLSENNTGNEYRRSFNTSGRSYRCEDCGVTFSRRYPLKLHKCFLVQKASVKCEELVQCSSKEEIGQDDRRNIYTAEKKCDENGESIYCNHIKSHLCTCLCTSDQKVEDKYSEIHKYPSVKDDKDIYRRIYTVNNKNYKCEKCGETFYRSYPFKSHKCTFAEDKSEKLKESNIKSLPERENREEFKPTEFRPTHKLMNYECEECGKGFTQLGRLKRHTIVHSKSSRTIRGGDVSEQPHQQPSKADCKEVVDKVTEYEPISEGNVHPDKSDMLSDIGMKTQKLNGENNTGLKRGAKNIKRVAKNIFKCRDCRKRFSNEDKFKQHVKLHIEKSKYRCECGRNFIWLHDFKRHQIIHSERVYKCNKCAKAFYLRNDLKIHSLSHTKEKRYKCKVCGKYFCRWDNFKRHKKIHLYPKSYVCNDCGMFFPRRSFMKFKYHRLSQHQKLVEDDELSPSNELSPSDSETDSEDVFNCRIFTCNICSKLFPNESEKRRHIVVHTGEKNFKCDECGKNFSRKDNLSRHIHNHALRDDPVCEECGMRFPNKSHLSFKLHMIVCHQSVKEAENVEAGLKEKQQILQHCERESITIKKEEIPQNSRTDAALHYRGKEDVASQQYEKENARLQSEILCTLQDSKINRTSQADKQKHTRQQSDGTYRAPQSESGNIMASLNEELCKEEGNVKEKKKSAEEGKKQDIIMQRQIRNEDKRILFTDIKDKTPERVCLGDPVLCSQVGILEEEYGRDQKIVPSVGDPFGAATSDIVNVPKRGETLSTFLAQKGSVVCEECGKCFPKRNSFMIKHHMLVHHQMSVQSGCKGQDEDSDIDEPDAAFPFDGTEDEEDQERSADESCTSISPIHGTNKKHNANEPSQIFYIDSKGVYDASTAECCSISICELMIEDEIENVTLQIDDLSNIVPHHEKKNSQDKTAIKGYDIICPKPLESEERNMAVIGKVVDDISRKSARTQISASTKSPMLMEVVSQEKTIPQKSSASKSPVLISYKMEERPQTPKFPRHPICEECGKWFPKNNPFALKYHMLVHHQKSLPVREMESLRREEEEVNSSRFLKTTAISSRKTEKKEKERQIHRVDSSRFVCRECGTTFPKHKRFAIKHHMLLQHQKLTQRDW